MQYYLWLLGSGGTYSEWESNVSWRAEEKSTCCFVTSDLCACVNTDRSAMCPSPTSHLLNERVQFAATGGESGNSWFAHLAINRPFDVSNINGLIYGGGGQRKLAWQQLVFPSLTLFTSTFVAAVLTWTALRALCCSSPAALAAAEWDIRQSAALTTLDAPFFYFTSLCFVYVVYLLCRCHRLLGHNVFSQAVLEVFSILMLFPPIILRKY